MINENRLRSAKALFFVGLVLLLLSACNDDDDNIVVPVPAPVIEFGASTYLIPENGESHKIVVTLDKPASTSGVFNVSLPTPVSPRFTTVPQAVDGVISLAVEKNQSSVSFDLIPVNNNVIDDELKFHIHLTSVSEGFVLGDVKSSEIRIADDEHATKANFLLNIGSVRENRLEGLDVVVVFTGFTTVPGTVDIAFDSPAGYGTDFITEPAMVDGKIHIDVPAETDYLFYRFIPLDDKLINGDRAIRFTLAQASGGIEVGDSKTLDITLLDDESFPIFHVADVRALYKGENDILDDMLVTGVVTSLPDNTAEKTMFIEDETGGIAIRLLVPNEFTRGDKLLLNLDYGLLKETHGVLEVQQVSHADKIGTAPLLYDMMTLEELYNDPQENEGTLVIIHGITFTEADGSKTMQGDRIISDGNHTILVRTLSNSSFKDKLVPTGDMIVRGILTEKDGTFILYPQVFSEDVVPNAEYQWP